jgi:NAD(P)-dependent dehydrogenase (short-subunit alcohol dehydrogenase family)
MPTKQAVLVTGATAGIGLDAAAAFARRGHHVFATGRNVPALADLRALGEKERWHLETLPLDVIDAASIAAAASRVDESTAGRGLDVLVNNAGYATVGPLAELSIDAVRRQFETNVFGALAVTQAFLPSMFRRRKGRIVNVSSVSGRIPAPMLGAYHASKYALEALSDALRMELAAFGIDVVLVEPGTIRTQFASRTLREMQLQKLDASRYAGAYARAASVEGRFDKLASPVAPVTLALVRAIEARRPCTRYVAPGRFWLAIALVRGLPTRLTDAAMRWAFGLTKKQLQVTTKTSS